MFFIHYQIYSLFTKKGRKNINAHFWCSFFKTYIPKQKTICFLVECCIRVVEKFIEFSLLNLNKILTDLLLSTAYNLHILFNVFLFFPFCLFFKYRNIPLSMLKLVMSVEVSSSSDDKPSLCSALFPFCSLACRRRVLHPSTNTKEAKLKT